MQPTTQIIRLSWRPELRFYERRIAVLRELDDRGLLRAFRVGNNHVETQLTAGSNQLRFSQGGLNLLLVGEVDSHAAAWDAMQLVVDQIQPKRYGEAQGEFQFVLPLDLDFEQAIERGYSRLFTGLSGGSWWDWALLADLRLPGPPPAGGQV